MAVKSQKISQCHLCFFSHELGTTIAGSIDSSLKGLFGIFVLGFFLQKENHACSANFVFCFWKKDVVVR